MTEHTILVADTATQQHAYLVSKTRPFRINEILVVEDNSLNNPKCEVIETSSMNRNFTINNNNIKILDQSVIENLRLLDIDINEDTVHIAKVMFLNELIYPVTVGSSVRTLNPEEVELTYIKGNVNRSFKLGAFNSTEELYPTMRDEYKNLFTIFDSNKKQMVPQNKIPFIYNFRELDQYPHIQITGGSGSGKSFLLRALLEEIMIQGIPAICLDPHMEFDFSEIMDKLPKKFVKDFKDKYVIYKAGEDVTIDFQHLTTGEIIQLISANTRNFSEHMENAIRVTHEKNDTYDYYITKLRNIQLTLELTPDEIEQHAQGDKLKEYKAKYGNIGGSKVVDAVIRRLESLKNQQLFGPQGFEHVGEQLLQGKLVVIQGQIKYLRMFSGFLLNHFYKKRRNYRDNRNIDGVEPFPGFFVIFDEAHNFAPNNTEDMIIPSKYVIREIAQEGRKYGIFLVPATQRPSLLDNTTQAQINTKFILRTTRESDIENIRKETDLSKEDIRRLPYLQSGNCFVSSPILGRTVFIQVRSSYTKSPHSENSFDETFNLIRKSNNELLDLLKDDFPINETDIPKIVNKLNVTTDKEYDSKKLVSELDQLVSIGKLKKLDLLFDSSYVLNE